MINSIAAILAKVLAISATNVVTSKSLGFGFFGTITVSPGFNGLALPLKRFALSTSPLELTTYTLFLIV